MPRNDIKGESWEGEEGGKGLKHKPERISMTSKVAQSEQAKLRNSDSVACPKQR